MLGCGRRQSPKTSAIMRTTIPKCCNQGIGSSKSANALRDHEPGNPENKLDRWPIPFLAGEIAGDPADPEDIFGARERITMVPRDGLTVEETYKFLIAEMHWARQHAPNDAAARPQRHLADLTNLDPIGPP
jgi:hypothetical protein